MNGRFQDELDRLREEGLERHLRALPHTGPRIRIEEQEYLNFSSNDYLNLANDPDVIAAAKAAIEAQGCGATASRLMTGNLNLHTELERGLAHLVRQETALLFPSGYQTNLALLSTLARRGDTIYSDQFNHASIIDGARLSRADVRVYPHRDHNALAEMLATDNVSGHKLIVSDAVFSMDGDAAPVRELRRLADEHDALLIIDEAHAVGIYAEGAGWCVDQGIRSDVTVGTLSKSFGAGGGFIACSTLLRDFMINRARPFIYSTGLSPSNVGAALAALEKMKEQPLLGAKLLEKSASFRALLRASGLEVGEENAPIIPIIVGSNQLALDLATELRADGLIATAIRPPTVPEGTARLRLTITLGHTDADLEHAAKRIAGHLLPRATV